MFIIGATFLLFLNEGAAVARYNALAEGESAVRSINPMFDDPSWELADGKAHLVHAVGTVSAPSWAMVHDEEFGLHLPALALRRSVQQYQWSERRHETTREETDAEGHKHKHTTVSYSYTPHWSSQTIDSSRFHEPYGHQNPGFMPFKARESTLDEAQLGELTLTRPILQRLRRWKPAPLHTAMLPPNARVFGSEVYIGNGSPTSPFIGDLRVTFEWVPLGDEISVVAARRSRALVPHKTSAADELLLVEWGARSASEMFSSARSQRAILTWVLRLLGFALMTTGFCLLLEPLKAFTDIIPIVGPLVQMGAFLVSIGVALPLCLIISAVAWVYYRPLVAFALAAVALTAAYFAQQRAAQAPSVGHRD